MTPSTTASVQLVETKLRPPRISLERHVRIWAGALVLAGVMLGFHVNPLFHLLSAVVGATLLWSSIFDSCYLALQRYVCR
jgi:hypothetical protein